MKLFTAPLLCACLWLSGCGQTGPLYLPESRQQPAPPASAEPAPEQPAQDTPNSQQ